MELEISTATVKCHANVILTRLDHEGPHTGCGYCATIQPNPYLINRICEDVRENLNSVDMRHGSLRHSLEESAQSVKRRLPHFVMPFALFRRYKAHMIEAQPSSSKFAMQTNEDKAHRPVLAGIVLPRKQEL